jgi:hypothetical protein
MSMNFCVVISLQMSTVIHPKASISEETMNHPGLDSQIALGLWKCCMVRKSLRLEPFLLFALIQPSIAYIIGAPPQLVM